jgi:hypothetical protein
MQIREGAYYRTRRGDIVGPIIKQDHPEWVWHYNNHSWLGNGGWNRYGEPRELDLISEVYFSDTPPSDAPAPEAKTLRDEFAMTVMGSLLYNRGETGAFSDYAQDAYEYADCMMEARKK